MKAMKLLLLLLNSSSLKDDQRKALLHSWLAPSTCNQQETGNEEEEISKDIGVDDIELIVNSRTYLGIKQMCNESPITKGTVDTTFLFLFFFLTAAKQLPNCAH